MSRTLEVLHVPDCPNVAPLLAHLRHAAGLPVTIREITTDAEAATFGMAGSPTLLVDGRDPFSGPEGNAGIACRIYRDEHGRPVPVPSVTQLRDAVTAGSAVALSAWRARALPLDPLQKAVHRTILRAFAASGRPPALDDLDAATAGSGREAADVLAELHDLDAVRLGPDLRIVAAYPFSAAPTRHRVRIANRVEAYAMCAIDALGIAAMLGEDTRIDSVDVTSGHAVSVATSGNDTTWDPANAVVFVGAEPAGGPSADCCCEYLNFFADTTAAHAWMAAHPQLPGQILTQAEAENLGTRLFGHLLTSQEDPR